MKNLLLLMMAVALLFTGCQKQNEFNQVLPTGDEVELTVNAATLSTTRADGNPEGLTYYLEAYYGDKLCKRYEPNTDGVFVIRLVTDIEFNLVAWADYDTDSEGGYYNTESLANITLNEGAGAINDEKRDAYYGNYPATISQTSVITMELTRPFARINVEAYDLNAVEDLLRPTAATWVYTSDVYQSFDATTGNVGEATEMTFTQTDTFYDKEGILTFDYLFAPYSTDEVQVRPLANFDLKFYKGEEYVTSYTFANIPYERNYQTNIAGNIFTKEGNVDITINDAWEEPGLIVYIDQEDVQTVIGQIDVGEEVTVYLTQDIIANADVTLQLPSRNTQLTVPRSATVLNLVVTSEIKEGATLNINNSGFYGTLNVTVANESAGTLNIPIYHAVINVDGSKVGKLQIYGETEDGCIHTVGAGLEVGKLYPRYCTVYVSGTVDAFYCNNTGQFGYPYIVVGEGSDRPDMSVEDALAAYVDDTATYTYAGVVNDDVVYTK